MKLRKLLIGVVLPAIVIGILFGCSGGGSGGSDRPGGGDTASGDPLLIGAHYYVWFPSNFSHGYVRPRLKPPQEPLFGEYDSNNPAVVEQQIALAADHGIDFFTLDYWPTRPRQNSAIDNGFLRAGNLSRIKFAIFYETIDLGYDEDRIMTDIDDDKKAQFVDDMRHIAASYFGHPSYLKIDGKPVIFFYVTRTLVGKYKEMFAEARAEIRKLGFEGFFIGDEIYWIASSDTPTGPIVSTAPNVERIRLFDAIMSYNLYSPPFLNHAGYASTSAHLAECSALYASFKQLVPDVPIVPGLLPGYNDRGHRLSIDHYVIPREYAPGAGQGSLLREYYNQIGAPYLDEKLRMMTITSWNEWNEETAIEPIAPATPTAEDGKGGAYTQGFPVGGSGLEALDTVRQISTEAARTAP